MTIFVSAGHYPSKPGATFEGFAEYDEAALWADDIVEKLDGEAVLVPTGFLGHKVGFINARSPVLAIEIHFNAAQDADGNNVGRGCETLYYPGSDKGEKLAEIVHSALTPIFDPDRGIKEGWYRMDEKNGPDYFLAKTTCPAVIIEPEFIHRKEIIQENRAMATDLLADALRDAAKELRDAGDN
jgi:N-acetylmuramoyl-L-alanine amidase